MLVVIVDQLGELKLGELAVGYPPLGLDEAITIPKVMQFVESPQYSMSSRMVFDTALMGQPPPPATPPSFCMLIQ